MNPTPYSYLQATMPHMQNPMMSNSTMPGQWNVHEMISEMETKFNRIQRQIKRLDDRLSHLEQEKLMPMSSKANIYPNQGANDGMYMM